MMFCKNCGSKLPDGSLFCATCGKNQSNTQYLPNEKPVLPREEVNLSDKSASVTNLSAQQKPPQQAAQQMSQQKPPQQVAQQMSQQKPPQQVAQQGNVQPRPVYAPRQNAVVSNGYVNANDMASGGFTLLGFLQPLLALILFIAWKDTSPLKARSFYKGFKIWVIIFIVGAAILAVGSVVIFFLPLLSNSGQQVILQSAFAALGI